MEHEPIDFNEVYRIAQEQSVVGLIAAGVEHVTDAKAPKGIVLTLVGETLQLEQRNMGMNDFISNLVEKMRRDGIYTLLVKGQGIAQCYERPLWRASGDVDFFLSDENYHKALRLLSPISSHVDEEKKRIQHIEMTIDGWSVELHGTMRNGLWKKLDRTIDDVKNAVFCGDHIRSWMNGRTQVFLPAADEDIIIVFTHIIQHFFSEGIGLRQICDWCRLLWAYRNSVKYGLLESRIKKAGLLSEWKAFAALAVNYLGMPVEAIPLYSESNRWKRKANKIMAFVIETGNFGHNRDYTYYKKYPYVIYKTISLWRHTKDGFRYFTIFPLDSVKVWWSMIKEGVRHIIRWK